MGNIVYSTDPDWQKKCPDCGELLSECACKMQETTPPVNQTIYLSLDRKGRKGKAVTLVQNLKGDLKDMQKTLQKLCGSGGTVKNGIIEIQGDHRSKIETFLAGRGFKIKFRGG